MAALSSSFNKRSSSLQLCSASPRLPHLGQLRLVRLDRHRSKTRQERKNREDWWFECAWRRNACSKVRRGMTEERKRKVIKESLTWVKVHWCRHEIFALPSSSASTILQGADRLQEGFNQHNHPPFKGCDKCAQGDVAEKKPSFTIITNPLEVYSWQINQPKMTHLFALFCPVWNTSGCIWNLLISLFRVFGTHVNTKVFNLLPPPTRGYEQTLHRELQADATGSYSDWTSTPFGVFPGEQKRPWCCREMRYNWWLLLAAAWCDGLHPNATLLVAPARTRPLLSSPLAVEIMQRIHPRSYVILFSCFLLRLE